MCAWPFLRYAGDLNQPAPAPQAWGSWVNKARDGRVAGVDARFAARERVRRVARLDGDRFLLAPRGRLMTMAAATAHRARWRSGGRIIGDNHKLLAVARGLVASSKRRSERHRARDLGLAAKSWSCGAPEVVRASTVAICR